MSIAVLVNNLFDFYFWLILVTILLTWFPSIDWDSQPFRTLYVLSEFVLGPFRRLIPSIGGIDFSPFIALLVFQFIQYAVVRILALYGL